MNPGHDLSPSQKEQTRHGERMFPLKRYITTLSDLCPAVTAHWHEEAELTMITDGACTYHIHLENYEAKTGDILFIPPAELHSITIAPGTGMTSATYVFHMDYLDMDSGDICAVKYLNPVSRHALILPYIIRTDHPVYEKMRSHTGRLKTADRSLKMNIPPNSNLYWNISGNIITKSFRSGSWQSSVSSANIILCAFSRNTPACPAWSILRT